MALVEVEPFSRRVIGCAIEVHRTLGPGLLESIYEAALCIELDREGLRYERRPSLPVMYKGHALDCQLRGDLIVERGLLVEIKSVQALHPVHEAQLLTYLKVTGLPAGLRLNFNEVRMIDGVRRRLLPRFVPGQEPATDTVYAAP